MTATSEKLNAILQSIKAVPDDGRRFVVTANVASRQYGFSAEVVEQLLELGMPVLRQDSELYFDAYDLANVSLHMGFSSIQRLAMRTWTKTLKMCEQGVRTTATIDVVLADEPPSQFQLIMVPQDIRAIGPILSLLEEFGQLRFFMLPEVCRWDIDFISTNKICECGGASKWLVTRALNQGLEARQCFGLLIAEPYSTGHYWTEFRIDGEWVAFDPVLIGLLQMVTRLTASDWPIHRSNNFALHRLCVIEDYDAIGTPILSDSKDDSGIVPLKMVMEGQTQVVSLPTSLSLESLQAK